MTMNKHIEDLLETAEWMTISSHPATGLAYQEASVDGWTFARVVREDDEVVSPTTETESVYGQYQGRMNQWIEDDETGQPLYGAAADRVRDALRKTICTCGRPEATSPALHAGSCPVWAVHHNLI